MYVHYETMENTSNTAQTSYSVYKGRGATGSRGQLTPLFQVWGPHMALDPFVVFTCAQSVVVVIYSFIHSFMYSFIQLTYCCSTDHR